MRIGSDFATVSALRLKVRAQARRISELESGGAYAEERELRLRLQREYESRVRSLRREVANVGGEQAQVLILANGEAAAMCARERKGHDGVKGTPL